MESNYMTVSQLIEILLDMPPSALVVIPAYEGGETSVVGAEVVPVILDESQSWYYGEWRYPFNGESSQEAVSLRGRR